MTSFILGLLVSTTECLAGNIYFEARNQSVTAQIAVAHVVLNRSKDTRYPSTPCQVVKQGRMSDGKVKHNQCQFSWYCDGKAEKVTREGWKQAMETARLAQSLYNQGIDFTFGATHYHATYVNPVWAKEKQYLVRIDDHIFYRW